MHLHIYHPLMQTPSIWRSFFSKLWPSPDSRLDIPSFSRPPVCWKEKESREWKVNLSINTRALHQVNNQAWQKTKFRSDEPVKSALMSTKLKKRELAKVIFRTNELNIGPTRESVGFEFDLPSNS